MGTAGEKPLERDAGHFVLPPPGSRRSPGAGDGRASDPLGDLAVRQEENAVGDRRGGRVMGDHHRRLAELVDRAGGRARGSRRSSRGRGCPWARRRAAAAAGGRARARWPRAAAPARQLARPVLPAISEGQRCPEQLLEPRTLGLPSRRSSAAGRRSPPPSAWAGG